MEKILPIAAGFIDRLYQGAKIRVWRRVPIEKPVIGPGRGRVLGSAVEFLGAGRVWAFAGANGLVVLRVAELIDSGSISGRQRRERDLNDF